MRPTTLALAFAALLSTTAANAVMPITVSLESEKPGIQASTSGFNFVGVEKFDSQKTGTGQSFETDFGSSGIFTGKYTGVQILKQDKYGAAGGKGNYAVTFSNKGYSLDLATKLDTGVTYFGFWLSALDRGNNVTFFNKDKQLFTFSASDAKTFIDGLKARDQYYCNPNEAFKGQNCGEPYAFLNFYAAKGTSFDRIVFAENPEKGGYESDNHTVGQWNKKSGTIIPATGTVPEPQTWALLIAGFSMVGTSLRRRSRSVAA
jgi:hypothetical protein